MGNNDLLILGHRGCTAITKEPENTSSTVVNGGKPKPVIIENTLESFQNAVNLGADGFELDIQLTQDGYLIVFHDFSLPNGERIHATSFDNLPSFIPTLNQVVEMFQSTTINIEMKCGTTDSENNIPLELIKFLNSQSDQLNELDLIVTSFSLNAVRKLSEIKRDINFKFGLLVSPNTANNLNYIHEISGLTYVVAHWAMVNSDMIDLADKYGLRIICWTVNEAVEMIRLRALRVAGIITDDTELALKVLRP